MAVKRSCIWSVLLLLHNKWRWLFPEVFFQKWRKKINGHWLTNDSLVKRTMLFQTVITRNVGQCPTWWSPCQTWVAPSVQHHKVSLTPSTCSNAAKMRNPLKFAGVPQTTRSISAASGPKFTILWGHVEDILLLNKFFFPIVDTCLSCEDIALQSCPIVPRWRFLATFLRPVFLVSRVQQVSVLRLKFALRPHHVCKYSRHPPCNGWD